MLKIYKTYLQYQIDGGCWERFGYSGWLCEEECNVELQKRLLKMQVSNKRLSTLKTARLIM